MGNIGAQINKEKAKKVGEPTKKRTPKKDEFECYACKQFFNLEEKYKNWGKNFCKECGRKVLKEKERTENINEIPFGEENFRDNSIYSTNYEIEEIKEFIDYTIELCGFNVKQDYSLLVMQFNRLIQDYQCNPQGIYLTLKYLIQVLGNLPPESPYIVTLVAYNYGAAIRMYKQQKALKINYEDTEITRRPVVNVYVAKGDRKNYNHYFDNRWRAYENMIGIDEIKIDEEDGCEVVENENKTY